MYTKLSLIPDPLWVGGITFALVVVALALGLKWDRDIEARMATAPAHVAAYLHTLGVAAQGAILCRPEERPFSTSIYCEAMVGNMLMRFSCDAETCWAR
jgi:L-alanine-DL-glutamate epimerase-like enolase superfamily enzyme